jgi:hypothetical protein
VQHSALEAELFGGAFEFIGGGVRHRRRQRREGGEALGTAVSAGSFCVDGAPCEITCTSMPTSSISLMRMPAKSCSRLLCSPGRPASLPV